MKLISQLDSATIDDNLQLARSHDRGRALAAFVRPAELDGLAVYVLDAGILELAHAGNPQLL